jgi:hypothetical protein
MRDGDVPQVVLELEALVVDPDGARAARNLHDPLPIARHARQSRRDGFPNRLEVHATAARERAAREELHGDAVHREPAALPAQEVVVLGGEAGVRVAAHGGPP